jgi:ATP-dependent DNA ligase
MDPDPSSWRPQAFGRRRATDVEDPVIEPAWEGVRVLAHLDAAAARVAIHDVTGVDLTDDHGPIADALLAALAADTAILDGYLTDQPLSASEGPTNVPGEITTVSEQVSQLFLGRRGIDMMSGRGRPNPGEGVSMADGRRDLYPDAPIAFVAVDLVELDGRPLVEIPLLERKRLLESVLLEGDLVRRTPYVREPAGAFILTWRAFGFRALAYKAANSRYRPGAANDDWCLRPMPRR